MKKLILQSIFTLCVLFIQATSNAQAVTGNYCPAYLQTQTQWCWAASSQMVYWCYKPGFITQCDAANKSKTLEMNTGCNNLANSATSACANPGLYNNPQSMYGCSGSLQSILSSYGISSSSNASALSAFSLTLNAMARKLMIARWGWNGGGGHFVVVNRYKSGYVYYNNPLSGAVTLTYNSFKTANGSGTWTHTLTMNSAALYGGALYRERATTQEIVNNATELSMNFYPNPATEKVNIVLNGDSKGKNHILISDAVGKIIYQQDLETEEKNLSIDVSNWGRGLYFITLNHNKATSRTLSVQ